jgi:hypothetical protein
MESIQKLKDEIATIGKNLVACSENCEGVCRNQSQGILPRCLIANSDFKRLFVNDLRSKSGGLKPKIRKSVEEYFKREPRGIFKL